MIRSRTAAGGLICLRQQLRRPKRGAAVVLAITNSTTSWLRCSFFGHQRQNGTLPDAAPSNLHDQRVTKRNESSEPSSSVPQNSTGTGFRRLQPGRSLPVYLRTESLAVGILGQPAKAIVLGDLQARGTPSRKIDQIPAESIPAESSDFLLDTATYLSLNGDDSGSPTLAATHTNIEELRPADAKAIRKERFDDIAAELNSGFLKAQLESYIEAHRAQMRIRGSNTGATDASATATGDVQSTGTDSEPPWIVERLPWAPMSVEGREHPDPLLDGYSSKGMTNKELTALRVMRECWNLSKLEVEYSRGHLDVRLRDPEFALLLVGTKRWLQSVSRLFLKNVGGRIELQRSDGLLRIVAPKIVAEAALDELNRVLSRAVTKTFKLSLVQGSHGRGLDVTPAVLEELSRMTNACVYFSDAERSELSVSWIHDANRDSGLEDVRDIVFRLLLTANQRGHASTSLSAPSQRDMQAKLLNEHRVRQGKLPWSERAGAWGRWVKPCSLASQPTTDAIDDAPPIAASKIRLKWPLDPPVVHPAVQTEPFAEHLPVGNLWTLPRTTTAATFGLVLHSLPPPGSSRVRRSKTYADPTLPRLLYPITPPLLSNPFPGDDPGDLRVTSTSTTVMIRLLPSPRCPAAANAPPLEISLHATPDGIVGNVVSLTALHTSDAADVMLPDQPVDVRYVQRRVSELSGEYVARNPSMAPLRDFLAISRLSVAESVFDTPAVVTGLALPSSFLGRVPQGLPGDPGENAPALTKVDYVFGAVEVRRRVASGFRGWTLTHTSIEAGQAVAVGSRAELTLEAEPWERPGPALLPERSKHTTKDFVDATMALARGRQFKWVL